MPTHLPPDDMLADYACGSATPGVSLLVAAHLSQAPESARRVQAFEAIGGALLLDEPATDMADTALADVLARLDDSPDAVSPPQRKYQTGPMPQAVVDALGVDFDDIPWKFRLPGVSVCDLEGYGDEKVSLLRAKPGASVPQHTHDGIEMTLVMQGILMDEGVEYHRGDLAINDETDDHRPRILGDEICYCLIVQRGNLRFTGTFSRILNYLGE